MVVRFGAIGDAVIMSPLVKVLDEDGYDVTLNCNGTTKTVLNNNPHVKAFHVHDMSIPADERLDRHLEEDAKGYDKFINLCESIEGSLLKVPTRKDFYESQEERHAKCNVNYYDRMLELGGYPEIKGLNGELYFTPQEYTLAGGTRRKYKNKFLVLWCLSGSSPHKVYAYAEYVANSFLNKHEDAVILTVGDDYCVLIEFEHDRAKNYCGVWGIRKTLLMTKLADLVIGSETGVLNAAGCFDTPKILMLSHSSSENISKYWKNCVSIEPEAKCYPCHRLHYTLEHCALDPYLCSPLCTTKIKPEVIFNHMEDFYNQWRNR